MNDNRLIYAVAMGVCLFFFFTNLPSLLAALGGITEEQLGAVGLGIIDGAGNWLPIVLGLALPLFVFPIIWRAFKLFIKSETDKSERGE